MAPASVDVAIIGAGPTGLSLATHLHQRGVEHRIFGFPMEGWRSLPEGMYLKSLGFATSIPTPLGHPTLPEYCRARGVEDYEPIEYSVFANYGLELQRSLVPYLEETKVRELAQSDGRFNLSLESGERLQARAVVVAVGLGYFAHLPKPLENLTGDRVSHTSAHEDYSQFGGLDVLVVGGGASALEAAASLHGHGAHVRLIVRRSIIWNTRGPKESERSWMQRTMVPLSAIGHGRLKWVLQHAPSLVHYVPTRTRLWFTGRYLGPAGCWWLRDRVEGQFPIESNASMVNASIRAGKVSVQIQQGEEETRELLVDHVVAGTGYRVDLDRVDFIDPVLRRDIQRNARAPRLSRHFESSVRGLYFAGPAAASSFGPLQRFVAGAAFAVPVVAAHLSKQVGSHRIAADLKRTPATSEQTPAALDPASQTDSRASS